MNFIWDMVLRAEEQGLDRSDVFFRQAEQYSPCYEQSLPDINQKEIHTPINEINALYRFSHIFQEILHPDMIAELKQQELDEFANYFFDIIMHILSEIDLKHGLNKREYFVRKLSKELLGGVYGETAAVTVASLERKLQLQMANELLTQMQTGASLLAFRRAALLMFADCFIYQSNFNCKELLIYIGEKKTNINQTQMDFVIDSFLPLGFSAKIFWQYHFGIIGIDATMQSDAIAIF